MLRRFRPGLLPLVGLIVLAGCDGDDPDPIDPDAPLDPVDAVVLADESGSFAAAGEGQAFPSDTIEVVLPANRRLGVIVDATAPVVAQYPGGVVSSGFSGPFAAIVQPPQADTTRLIFFSPTGSAVSSYHVRVIAVDDTPEHAEEELATGEWRHELVDPTLDLDVFTADLEQGDRFRLEVEADGETPVAVHVVPPQSPAYYAFVATGPGEAQSAIFEAQHAGVHEIEVYSAGLAPDLEAEYRVRLIDAE